MSEGEQDLSQEDRQEITEMAKESLARSKKQGKQKEDAIRQAVDECCIYLKLHERAFSTATKVFVRKAILADLHSHYPYA